MKLALVISSLGPGGAKRNLVTLANSWASRGYDVSLFTFDDDTAVPAYDLDKGIDHRPLDLARDSANPLFGALNNVWRIARLNRELRRAAPTAVVSFIDRTNVLVLLASFGVDAPVVVSERVDPTRYDIGWAWRLLRRWSYRRAASIVVQTASILQHLPVRLRRRAAGGGLETIADDVVTTDVLPAPWLDTVADAHALPFADASFANIAMLDVLHHLSAPRAFFDEAVRVLRPGGRLVMIEPAITPVSRIFYTWFHPEPVVMDADPLAAAAPDPDSDPFDANQAIPTLLFLRQREALADAVPELSLRSVRLLSLFAYPLTGGFRPWSLIPRAAVAPMLRLEDRLAPVLGRLMAFRLFVVLERS